MTAVGQPPLCNITNLASSVPSEGPNAAAAPAAACRAFVPKRNPRTARKERYLKLSQAAQASRKRRREEQRLRSVPSDDEAVAEPEQPTVPLPGQAEPVPLTHMSGRPARMRPVDYALLAAVPRRQLGQNAPARTNDITGVLTGEQAPGVGLELAAALDPGGQQAQQEPLGEQQEPPLQQQEQQQHRQQGSCEQQPGIGREQQAPCGQQLQDTT